MRAPIWDDCCAAANHMGKITEEMMTQ